MLKDKVPPHNAEAEQAVLGALLLDWNAATDIVTILRADRSDDRFGKGRRERRNERCGRRR